jgi:TolA-binding protein
MVRPSPLTALKGVLALALLLCLPAFSADAPSGGDFFVVFEGGAADSKLGFDPGEEKMFDTLRDTLSDEEVNNLKSQKGDLYNTVDEDLKNERWDDAIFDLKKYVDLVRQIYGPGDYAYREVVSDCLYMFAKAFMGKQNYVDAVRCYQRILQTYKDTPMGPKAAIEWARVFSQLFTGELQAVRGLTAPEKDILLKRILYVKVLKPKDELVADAYLMAADVLIFSKEFVEARKYLDMLDKEFPRSPAAEKLEDRRKKLE